MVTVWSVVGVADLDLQLSLVADEIGVMEVVGISEATGAALETCTSVLEDDAARVAAGVLVETTAATVELMTKPADVELATGEADAEPPLVPFQTAGPGIV
jgi:hypothetical protein